MHGAIGSVSAELTVPRRAGKRVSETPRDHFLWQDPVSLLPTLSLGLGKPIPSVSLSACGTRRSSSSLEEMGCYSDKVASRSDGQRAASVLPGDSESRRPVDLSFPRRSAVRPGVVVVFQ